MRNQEESQRSQSKGLRDCWYYGKSGHKKKDCWNQKNNEGDKP